MIEKEKPHPNLHWLKISTIVLVVIIVIGGVGVGAYFLVQRNNTVSLAPDFSVEPITGGNFTLSNYRGKVVLIDFMSVTCVPCEQLMPELVIFSNQFNDSLVIISIDVDPTDSKADLLFFKESNNATWDFAFDIDNLQDKYSVTQIPKTIIIDKEGYITYSQTGFTSGSNLEEKIQETIEGTAERITGGYGFSLSIAFIAGIISFFSPCAFPLLPGYMAYNLELLTKEEERKEKEDKKKKKEREVDKLEEETNETAKEKVRRRVWKSFLWGLSAALGVALFYMVIGIIAAFFGEVIGNWVEYVTPVVGGLLIILGIISLTPLQLNMGFATKWITNISINAKRRKLKRRAKRQNKTIEELEQIEEMNGSEFSQEAPQLIQLFLYGVTYALASIGCNGPIILGLTLKSIETGAFVKALLVFLVYSLAMALLMVVITMLVGFSRDILIEKLKASTKIVKILSGILLILAGGFMLGYSLWNILKT